MIPDFPFSGTGRGNLVWNGKKLINYSEREKGFTDAL
jgi:hypothetical protein